jgi:hypothetical protein
LKEINMRTLILARGTRRLAAAAALFSAASMLVLAPASASPSKRSTTLCVGQHSGCFATVRAALRAAHDGDTIKISRGTYAGGFTITKSVRLLGAGQATRISGGGPVISIKSRHGMAQLTVTIESLTVRGGRAKSKGFVSLGGGIDIQPAVGKHHNQILGATVTLRDVTVTDNEASDSKTSPSPSGVKCPHSDCPFALAEGGGVFNGGNLTVVHSSISDNRLDGRLSDADGAGIYSAIGTLKVTSSTITGNKAEPVKIGRFAEGGGIFVNTGTLVVRHSTVSDNEAKLVTSWPVKAQGTVINMGANSGGIHMGDGGRATVTDSAISHNRVVGRDTHGESVAFDSAMLVGNSHLSMSGTTIADNTGTTVVASTADTGFGGTALELDAGATVTGSRIVGNTAITTSPHGVAGASNAVAVFDFFNDPRQVTFSHDTISDNTATSVTTDGTAIVTGAGILNNSLLHLVDSTVRDNTGTVKIGVTSGHSAAAPTAQGGGIWNGPLLSGPPVTLQLDDTMVTGNTVTGPAGATLQGGGIYTTLAITSTNSRVTHNHPNNCTGC